MLVWETNSLKPCALSSWWAEGFIHNWIPQTPKFLWQQHLLLRSTRKVQSGGNIRKWMSCTHSENPSLQLWFCFSDLFATCDRRQQAGGCPPQGTDHRARWQSAVHSRSRSSLPAAHQEHWQFYLLVLWCSLTPFSCSHRNLWKQISNESMLVASLPWFLISGCLTWKFIFHCRISTLFFLLPFPFLPIAFLFLWSSVHPENAQT